MKKKKVKKVYTCPKCKEGQNSVLRIYKVIKTHLINLSTNFSARSGEQLEKENWFCPTCNSALPKKLAKKVSDIFNGGSSDIIRQSILSLDEYDSNPNPEF